MSKVILYEIPTRGRASCFSHNVWKTRLVLNYKQIPYETVWLDHADIESTLKSISAPPTLSPTGQEVYTVPTILLPSGTAISDSLAIAQWAEQERPTPSIHLTITPHALAAQRIATAAFPLIPVFMPRIPRTVIRPSSLAYFTAARAARFGMPLDQLEEERGGEQAWKVASAGLDDWEAIMGQFKVDEGPFVLGSQVSYADFMLVAVLEGFRRIGQDLFERIVEGREGPQKRLKNDTMTIASDTSPSHPPLQHSSRGELIAFALLVPALIISIATYSTCPGSQSSCTLTNDFAFGSAVLLAYLAAIGFYTSQNARVLFPLVAVCHLPFLEG